MSIDRDYCQNYAKCLASGNNFKSKIQKSKVGKTNKPKEANKFIQLGCWRPINYLNESKKYVLVAVERFQMAIGNGVRKKPTG